MDDLAIARQLAKQPPQRMDWEPFVYLVVLVAAVVFVGIAYLGW